MRHKKKITKLNLKISVFSVGYDVMPIKYKSHL